MNKLLDYYYWFSQPLTILQRSDQILGLFFAVCMVLAVIFFVVAKFIQNPINKKLVYKLANLSLTEGLIGLLWFGLRYENTPIFALRYWAGIIMLGGLVWLVFIFKYLAFNFRTELAEHNREQINKRYLS